VTLAEDYAGAAIPKHPPKRDPKYRAWIARQACLIAVLMGRWNLMPLESCRMYKVHAAHVPTGTGGTGMKGDDLFVPLCFHHHINEQHGRGVLTFMRNHNVDLVAEAQRYREEYDRGVDSSSRL
jgi:hypothetical protein